MTTYSFVRMCFRRRLAVVAFCGLLAVIALRTALSWSRNDSSPHLLSQVRGLDCAPLDPKTAKRFLVGDQALSDDIRKELPFRAGMTAEEVQQHFEAHERRVDAAIKFWRRVNRWFSWVIPASYAQPENRYYSPIAVFQNARSRTFWFNGKSQFWMTMAMSDGRVKNIYIILGNFSVMGPPFLFDGEGEIARYDELHLNAN